MSKVAFTLRIDEALLLRLKRIGAKKQSEFVRQAIEEKLARDERKALFEALHALVDDPEPEVTEAWMELSRQTLLDQWERDAETG